MTSAEMVEDLECLIRLEKMTDEDIDFSDIPEITDFSHFRPARDFLRKTAQWNHDHRPEIIRHLRKQAEEEEREAEAEREGLREEGRLEAERRAAANLLRLGKLTLTEIAEGVGLPLTEVQELARRTA